MYSQLPLQALEDIINVIKKVLQQKQIKNKIITKRK